MGFKPGAIGDKGGNESIEKRRSQDSIRFKKVTKLLLLLFVNCFIGHHTNDIILNSYYRSALITQIKKVLT